MATNLAPDLSGTLRPLLRQLSVMRFDYHGLLASPASFADTLELEITCARVLSDALHNQAC